MATRSEVTTRTDKIESAEEVFDYLLIPSETKAAVLPYATRLHEATQAFGDSAHADLLRMDICHRLRLGQDDAFRDGNVVHAYARLVERLAAYASAAAELPTWQARLESDEASNDLIDVTAGHYGRLWDGFSPDHYYGEATELLRTRMERNGFDVSWLAGKRAIDSGCGGGRYSVALKNLGCSEVVGVDWSEEALDVARQRVASAGIKGVSYERTSVLDLPFAAGEFDFAFSNGVFHHTDDTQAGVDELVRVMKSDGRGWLYLYSRPGGLDRLTHYLARLLLKSADHEVCRRYCRALGLPGNRVFFLLDLWLTPVAESYTPEEMDSMLEKAGALNWRRLERGADYDNVEQLRDGSADAVEKFGVGENRYVFEGKSGH